MTKTCIKCNKDKDCKEFYKQTDRKKGASYCKNCFNEYCMERWINKKLLAIASKGGACERCGLKLKDSHYSVFEFHHTNPATKEFNWTRLRLRSISSIKKELDKCDLLCANCHRITHAEE